MTTTPRGSSRLPRSTAAKPNENPPVTLTAQSTADLRVAEWVAASRRDQNLSARIEDESVLTDVRRLMAPCSPARKDRAA